MPIIKTYLAEISEGVVPGTWWPNGEVGSNQEAKRDHLRKMFPGVEPFSTPKPERLLRRIVEIATNPGDIVLDCFAGSGTTAAVAHKLGRRWVTCELVTDTVNRFTKRRLTKVVHGEDPWGVTTVVDRVPTDDVELPAGVSPQEAQVFQRVLKKLVDTSVSGELHEDEEADEGAGAVSPVAIPEPLTVDIDQELSKAVRAANKRGDGPLDPDETKVFLSFLKKLGESDFGALDVTKAVKSALMNRTNTKEQLTQVWYGGGGFTHLEVGPSMFASIGDLVVLAEWATRGDLAKAMCAQLGVRYRPDGIFAAKRGKVRYVILDGLVGEGTVAAIVDQLPEGQIVEVWATQIDPDAQEALRKARRGSRLTKIPEAVLDTYRRQTAKESPFKRRDDAAKGAEK